MSLLACLNVKPECRLLDYYLRARRLPSELLPAARRPTRADAFAEVWGELQELLQINPALEAKTLFEYVQRQYRGRFQDGQLRPVGLVLCTTKSP